MVAGLLTDMYNFDDMLDYNATMILTTRLLAL
jgi:hypothetical protein